MPIDKSEKSDIIGLVGDDILRVSTGGIRNERELTEEEIECAVKYAISLGMPVESIRYSNTYYTGYGSMFDILLIGTDVYPAEKSQDSPNSNISMHGAIAHEIIGHRKAALAGKTQPTIDLEEAQASIRAAKFTPNLSYSERIMLYRDGLTRLRKSEQKLKNVKHTLYIFEE